MPDSRPVVKGLVALALLAPATMAQTLADDGRGRRSNQAVEKDAGQGQARHPLDPLDPDEIRLAVAILREMRKLPDSYKFVSIALNEPAKALVLHPRTDASIPREARMVLLDRATGAGYEAIVNLSTRSVPRFEALPKGVQPPIMMDEFGECEEAARKSPAFREALEEARGRGHEPRDGRRLVGRPLRERAGGRPGQAARPGADLGQVRREGQRLRPPDRGADHRHRPEPQGGRAGRGPRGRAGAGQGGELGQGRRGPTRGPTSSRWRSRRPRGRASR